MSPVVGTMSPENASRKRFGQEGPSLNEDDAVFLSPHTAAAIHSNNNNNYLDGDSYGNKYNASNHSGIHINMGGRDLSGRLTPQNSFNNLQDSHSLMLGGQSLLAPPSKYAIERRHSNSSLDSYSSQISLNKRKSRRASLSRLSADFDEERQNVTLMTYAHAVLTVYQKMGKCCRRLFNSLFMPIPKRPKLVCEGEVMEQTSWICRDYVTGKLTQRDLLSRKVSINAANWPQSHPVIQAGEVLESMYPKTFSNVSRKLCMTMSSPKIVRNTLTLLLEVLFEGNTTWAKVVSMFAIGGLYAEECVTQGHPDFVEEVVDVIADFTGSHLLSWLVTQGGWDAFPSPDEGSNSKLSKLRLVLVGGGSTALLLTLWRVVDW